MPRFAANLALMYNEVEFLERFAAARGDGFLAVEAQIIENYPSYELRARLRAHDLRLVLFNAPAGDWAAGERGLAALPGREEEFRQSLMQALSYAQALECPRVHLMSGIVPSGATRASCRQTLIDNLCMAAPLAEAAGVMLLIEPINPRDFPGYFLNHQAEAHAVCAEVRERTGCGNVRVQMDFYHCQIVEGDLATRLRQHFDGIGHIQIAGVPDRHEPDSGEVNYPYLFDLMDELGYAGWVGCEYRPRGGTSAGLDWLRR